MSEWKVSSNFIGGSKVYQVYRLLNKNELDHSGNRKYLPGVFESKEAAQAVVDKQNEECSS